MDARASTSWWQRRGGSGRRRSWPRRLAATLALIASVTLVMWLIAALALWIYAGNGANAERHELLIAPGTAARVAAGGNPLDLPASWSLRSGDLLVIENRDAVAHTLGPWTVGPGTVQEITLRPEIKPLICSLHPSGSITLDVRPGRSDWGLSVMVALLLGPPLGLVAVALRRVSRSLDGPSESSGGAAAAV